jgi:hypothetical protein
MSARLSEGPVDALATETESSPSFTFNFNGGTPWYSSRAAPPQTTTSHLTGAALAPGKESHRENFPGRRCRAKAERAHEMMPGMTPEKTRWYHYLSYFFGGAFIANFIPHFVNGVSGSPFQSPFASPPGEGLSSSTVNVLWGLLNLLIGYLLVGRVGRFEHRRKLHVLVFGLAFVMMSIMLSRAFGRLHGGLLAGPALNPR